MMLILQMFTSVTVFVCVSCTRMLSNVFVVCRYLQKVSVLTSLEEEQLPYHSVSHVFLTIVSQLTFLLDGKAV